METATVRRRDAEEGRASAGELTLERRADGKLWALLGDAERVVWVRRCFPWSEPGRFVSLRDEDDNELALVGDPAELDPASRRARSGRAGARATRAGSAGTRAPRARPGDTARRPRTGPGTD